MVDEMNEDRAGLEGTKKSVAERRKVFEAGPARPMSTSSQVAARENSPSGMTYCIHVPTFTTPPLKVADHVGMDAKPGASASAVSSRSVVMLA